MIHETGAKLYTKQARNFWFGVGLVLLFSFGLVMPTRAESASLYLSPNSGTFFVGSTFDVSVFINTEGSSVNAVRADLEFPPHLLQVTSPTAGSSFISVWADQPYYSNKEGIISFKGGVPSPGINTSAGLVSTITFRVKSPGEAVISFLDSSQVLLSDGKGTNILKTSTGGEYFLTIPPPEGPKISSPTHSCQSCWYKDNNPSFFWEKEGGVTNFSYSLDRDPRGTPDNVSEGDLTQASFEDVSDGLWYFHIKAKKGGAWGGSSHYPVQIDAAPPEKPTVNIERIAKITGSRFLVSFSSKDLLSKIEHFEVSAVNMSDPRAVENPFFIEAASPYKIPYESAGKYVMIIRAYDKAGNYAETRSVLTIVTPLVSYTDKGLRIKNFYLSWWLIYGSIILLLSLLGFGAYYFLFKKKTLAGILKKEVSEAEKEIEDVRKMEEKIRQARTLEEEARKESKRLAERLRGKDTKQNRNHESRN